MALGSSPNPYIFSLIMAILSHALASRSARAGLKAASQRHRPLSSLSGYYKGRRIQACFRRADHGGPQLDDLLLQVGMSAEGEGAPLLLPHQIPRVRAPRKGPGRAM